MDENKALATVFTEEHKTISQLFIEQVVNYLQNAEMKIHSYGIRDSYNGPEETITLDLIGIGSVSINLTRNK